MRISDWSSDVCSSDLKAHGNSFGARRPSAGDREDGRSPGSELLPALAFPACGPVASRERGRSPYSRGGGTGLSPASRFTSWRGTVDRRMTATRGKGDRPRSEEHTSELQSLMRISYAVFCLKKKRNN